MKTRLWIAAIACTAGVHGPAFAQDAEAQADQAQSAPATEAPAAQAPAADEQTTGAATAEADPVDPQATETRSVATYSTTVTEKDALAPVAPERYGATSTTVTRERLEALPGGDTQPVSQLVAMQPGVVQDSFGSNLHVRGADGAILYVIDGIPLLSPSVGTAGQLLNTIPTRLIQNVDVVTGGFPVQYSYALGGVVDITTRKPTEKATGEVQLAYGSYDRVDAAINYAQKIKRVSILASGNFVSTQRGLDTPDAITALNDGRIGGNGFIKLRYDITAHDHLDLLGTYQQDTFHVPIDQTMLALSAAPTGAVRGNDVYGDGAPPFVPYDARPTDLERTLFAALSYHHKGDIRSQLSLYVREIYEDFRCDAGRGLGASADPGSTCSDFKRDVFHIGLLGQVQWRWLNHHTWKAGLQADDAPSKLDFSLYTRNDATFGPDAAQTLKGGDRINTFTGGLYLEDRIEIGNLTLQPGVRVDVQSTSFGSANVPTRTLTGPSVRLGASYAVAEPVTISAFAGYLSETPTNFDAPVVAPLVNPALTQTYPADMKLGKTWSGQLGVVYHPTPRLTVGIDGWGRILKDWLDHQNIGNTALWANFNWDQGWAAGGDVYATGEVARFWNNRFVLDAFGNVSGQQAKQKNIDSLRFLFGDDDLTGAQVWTVMDHVQFWTANAGLLLRDADNRTRLSMRFNYGSGFHTGVANNNMVPQHATVDVSVSHTFDLPVPTTLAVDAFNLFDDIYAYRLGTAFFGNSQFAPLRQFSVRLICNLG